MRLQIQFPSVQSELLLTGDLRLPLWEALLPFYATAIAGCPGVNGRATFNNLLHGFEKLLLFVNHVDLAGSFCGGHSEVPIVIALVCMIHGSISINQSYFIHGPVTP